MGMNWTQDDFDTFLKHKRIVGDHDDPIAFRKSVNSDADRAYTCIETHHDKIDGVRCRTDNSFRSLTNRMRMAQDNRCFKDDSLNTLSDMQQALKRNGFVVQDHLPLERISGNAKGNPANKPLVPVNKSFYTVGTKLQQRELNDQELLATTMELKNVGRARLANHLVHGQLQYHEMSSTKYIRYERILSIIHAKLDHSIDLTPPLSAWIRECCWLWINE